MERPKVDAAQKYKMDRIRRGGDLGLRNLGFCLHGIIAVVDGRRLRGDISRNANSARADLPPGRVQLAIALLFTEFQREPACKLAREPDRAGRDSDPP